MIDPVVQRMISVIGALNECLAEVWARGLDVAITAVDGSPIALGIAIDGAEPFRPPPLPMDGSFGTDLSPADGAEVAAELDQIAAAAIEEARQRRARPTYPGYEEEALAQIAQLERKAVALQLFTAQLRLRLQPDPHVRRWGSVDVKIKPWTNP
jgi:hypothetical protein